jgi:hypothetical protein
VTQLEQVSGYYLKRYGQTPHHRFAERLLWVDVDVTPLPIGAQAEGSERTWMGRHRSKTGRKVLRWTASAYREILHETLLRGKASAVPALKTALGELETRLGWTRERRQRIVLRLDGGFGTTEVLNGLLNRGYQVVAKISHSGRVRKLRQALGPWQPTSSLGREIAAVLKPHRFCRTTWQWVIRTPKEKGGYQYAVLVTTLTDLEPAALADAYDGRARIEASFCQDKQALGLVTRRQRRWEAPQMVLLLARLAQHLLLWGKRWRRGGRVRVRFSPLHPLATLLQASFSALFRGRVGGVFARKAGSCAGSVSCRQWRPQPGSTHNRLQHMRAPHAPRRGMPAIPSLNDATLARECGHICPRERGNPKHYSVRPKLCWDCPSILPLRSWPRGDASPRGGP